MASTWCFCQNSLLQCSSFTLKDADAFLTENPPALYSPGLTGVTNTSLKGRGRAGMSFVKMRNFRWSHYILCDKQHHWYAGGGGGKCTKKEQYVMSPLSMVIKLQEWGIFISSSYTICSLIYNKLSSLTWAQLNSSSVWAASTGKTCVTLFYLLRWAKTFITVCNLCRS